MTIASSRFTKKTPGNKIAAKRGHPTNLGLLSREDYMADRIVWVDLSELNDPTWFEKVRGYVDDLRFPTVSYVCGLSGQTILHVDDAFARIAATAAGKFCVRTTHDERPVPDLKLWGLRYERAIDLSKLLVLITRRDPYLVRYVATGYCWAASDSMRFYLRGPHEADFGQDLLELAHQLRLDVRLVGFRSAIGQTNAVEWAGWLGLDDPSQIVSEGVRDPSNPAEIDHLGIDVRIPGRMRKSREFHEVMLLTAATELWRVVRPTPMTHQGCLDLEPDDADQCTGCPYSRRAEMRK